MVNKNSFSLLLKNGNKIVFHQTAVMAICNVTPDSFFDGNPHLYKHQLLESKISYILGTNPDIIDIGGESSRPNAKPIGEKEEIDRITPAIKSILHLRQKNNDYKNILISIDTSKPHVAETAIDLGADIVNDISSGDDSNGEMLDLVLKYNIPIILMHKKGNSMTMQNNPTYNDVIEEIYSYLETKVKFLLNKGFQSEKIILDPGIGFGKTKEHNLLILKYLSNFSLQKTMPYRYPILMGASMKTVIGDITGKAIEDRFVGSIGWNLRAIENGANILRVHHPEEIRDAIKCFKI